MPAGLSNRLGETCRFRGPLGVGGQFIYRVRVPDKPKPIYLELPEDQLIPIPTPPQVPPNPSKRRVRDARKEE